MRKIIFALGKTIQGIETEMKNLGLKKKTGEMEWNLWQREAGLKSQWMRQEWVHSQLAKELVSRVCPLAAGRLELLPGTP